MVENYRQEATETSEMALIKAFELTFEVTWKWLNDELKAEGIIAKSPRQTLKHAFQQEMILAGEIWLEALAMRNETMHRYDDTVREKATQFIAKNFFPEVQRLYDHVQKKV